MYVLYYIVRFSYCFRLLNTSRRRDNILYQAYINTSQVCVTDKQYPVAVFHQEFTYVIYYITYNINYTSTEFSTNID